MALLDGDGLLLRVNPALASLTGYSGAELLSMDWTQLSGEAAGAYPWAELFTTLRQGLASRDLSTAWMRRDGQFVDVRVMLSALPLNGDGPPLTLMMVERNNERLLKEQQNFRVLYDRYRRLFSQLPDSVILFDMTGRVVDFNNKALEVYGYTHEEMLHLTIPDLEAKEDAAQVDAHKRRIRESGSDTFLTQHRAKDGRILEVQASVCIVEMESGEALFQCVFRDMTEIMRRSESLLLTEERLEMALDSAEEGIWDWDISSGSLITSPQWLKILGYQPGELEQHISAWEPLCHPDDLAEARRRLESHFRNEASLYELEHRLRHKDGHWVWVQGKAKVVRRDSEGKPLRMVGINVDITPRKQAEEKLKLQATMLDAISDTVFLLDLKGNFLYLNKAAWESRGYTREEMLSMNLRQLNVPAYNELLAPRFKQLLAEGHAQFESAHVRKDGSVMHVEIRSSLIESDGEKFFLSTIRDITERKRDERKLLERQAWLQAVLDNMPHIIWLKDSSGCFITANNLFLQQAGMHCIEDIVGKNDFDVWPEMLARKYRADDDEVMVSRSQKFTEEQALDRGHPYWSETFKTAIVTEGGEVVGTTGFSRDITERKRIEESLQIAALVYRNSGEAMLVTDEENRILDINPAFTRVTGYTLDEIRGLNPRIFKSGKHGEEFYRSLWQALHAQGQWQGEIWDFKKNGDLYAKFLTINAIRNNSGKIHRFVALFSDITEKKRAEELIWNHANIDPLTRLPNRRLFHDRLGHEILKANRAENHLALFFIDLDRFKQINDTLGHDAGDVLLVEASRRISECVRETDTVARLGGDEFTVILTELRGKTYAERIAQSIIEKLSLPFDLDGELGYISASIGITFYPDDANAREDLLKCADQAMYAAKNAGRNGFSYYVSGMKQQLQSRTSLGNSLHQALERNEFEVYFQPIVDIATRKTIKIEALLRWTHPQQGRISPTEFIPLAEELGLIRGIGDWVFQQAAEFARHLRNDLGREIQVSVNKSPSQFVSGVCSSDWVDTLYRLGLPGGSLVVEITEGLLLNPDPAIQKQLDLFRSHGAQIAIDDFGTGFSSLSYLKKFDIDYLKIDRSFIQAIASDENDRVLVEAIIAMAHKLRIMTIAEGVETEEQLRILTEYGCDLIQGYLFSHPLPANELEHWLLAHDA